MSVLKTSVSGCKEEQVYSTGQAVFPSSSSTLPPHLLCKPGLLVPRTLEKSGLLAKVDPDRAFMESVVSQTWGEPRVRLERVCRLLPGEIKPFSSHGNLNHFPLSVYTSSSHQHLQLSQVLASIRNWECAGSGGGRKLWLAPPNCLSEFGPSQALRRESGPAFPVGVWSASWGHH